MDCNKKLEGNRYCDVCVYGFFMKNLNKCPSTAFMLHPYVPLIVSYAMSEKSEISCDQGSVTQLVE